MNSPVSALAWEIGRRGRIGILIVAAIVSSCALYNVLVPISASASGAREGILIFLMILSFALVFGIYHYAEFNPRNNWHGFPYRLFTLPVSTWTLVTLPMVLGLVSVELLYLAWAKLVFEPIGIVINLWPGIVLGSGVVCYQCLVWSLAGFRIVRIVVLALMGMVLMDIAILPSMVEMVKWAPDKVRVVLRLLLAGLTTAAFVGGWFSVETQRHGGGRGKGWIKAFLGRMIDLLPRRRSGFASASAAQFWFEWRRAGLILPVCTGAVLLLIFVPVSWFNRNSEEATLWMLGWAVVLPIILAMVIGKGFGKPDFWSRDMSLPPFLTVRPLASGEMVVIKMKVAATSVAVAWPLVIGFLALWLTGWANTVSIKELSDAMMILQGPLASGVTLLLILILAMVLTWRGMVGSLWSGLAGSIRLAVVEFSLNVIMVALIIWRVVSWLDHFEWQKLEEYVWWMGWLLVLAVLLKIWGAAFSWRKITRRRVWKYILVWSVGTCTFVVLALLICPDIFWLKHLLILAALLPFPLARLGLAPLSVERNRHR
jgi:hypothetical protein